MSKWRSVRIGDLGRVVTGKTPPSSQPELFVGTVPFLTPSDMSDDARHIEPERHVSLMWDPKNRAILPADAICVVCIGATIGKVCMTSRPSHTNQQINSIIVNPGAFDPRFVYYTMRQKTDNLRSRAAGAATPIINKSSFSDVEIDCPSLEVQQKIGSILGAYDDLIEVNRRRVAVLEEMARGLFEEWFVRFRFPGHETVPILDTPDGPLPEGWTWKKLGQVATFKSGNNKLTKAAYQENGFTAYSASGPDGFVENAEQTSTGVVVSAVGAYCGKTWLASGQWTMIANTFAVFPTGALSAEFLYIATYGFERWPRRGAAQPFIAKGDASEMMLPLPTPDILAIFDPLVKNLHEMMKSINAAVTRLAASRDLLLPRLMSGQLSVAAAERETELA